MVKTVKPSTLPHAPWSCASCYALLTPFEQRIADIVKRLVRDAPEGAKWYQPHGAPICVQEGEPHGSRAVR